ncbi:N-acetyltransferase [Mucilaginibacter terrenus]|uniref:N-acetyltransferase n=1 Tax=Mucilaginibacter terrenus TaxID=2482727 RepID=A0A3E2NTW2_9SPHI|nr:GNAT family protein [Mucilaginibacter terrenus]RFZ84409.1 N-acetyltransferase [Mucilaginibacter terrenus]
MIKLEYFTPNDFQLLIDWINNEDLLMNWAGTQFRFPLTPDKLNWYIEDANDFNDSDVMIYKAVDEESGKTVGHVSLTALNRRNRSARITRVLVGNTGERGRGLGEQITRAVMKIGFEDFHLHRMSLGVYDFNQPAIRCYKKCGFQVDGVLRDISRQGDTFWSLMEMSILENEWRELNQHEEITTL